MVIGFIIWSVAALLFVGIGIYIWNAKKAVGLWANVQAPIVKDFKKFNKANAILMFIYAGLFEILGIPFLFLKQNSAGFVPIIIGVVALSIALMIAASKVEDKYRV